MKEIPLTRNMVAMVDNDDYDGLSSYLWQAVRGRRTWYAARQEHIPHSFRNKTIMMHRQILGLKEGDGTKVDHADGNGLNNQRYNIQATTNSQNLLNRGAQKNNRSGYKGVSPYYSDRHKKNVKWAFNLQIGRKRIRGNGFSNPEEASEAYQQALEENRGT